MDSKQLDSGSPHPRSSSEEEARLLRRYGRLPSFSSSSPTARASHALLARHLHGGGRKYFDSGDYALCKAGAGDSAGIMMVDALVGSAHPAPQNIPHPSPGGSAAGARKGMRLSRLSTDVMCAGDGDDAGVAAVAGGGNDGGCSPASENSSPVGSPVAGMAGGGRVG